IPSDKVMTGKRLANGEIRPCVSLINCAPLGGSRDFATTNMDKPYFVDYMKSITFPRTHIIDGNWNNYDGENEKLENIHLLHLTSMDTNPGVHMAIERLGDQRLHWYDGPIREHRRPDVVALFN